MPESWLESGQLTLSNGLLSPAAVIAPPLIVFPHRVAPSFHDLVAAYYETCGDRAHIAQRAIQMQTIVSLVSAGMDIALLPESLRHLTRTGTRYVGLQRDPPFLKTGMAWRRDDGTPIVANFLNILDKGIHRACPLMVGE
ncbi:MAG: LysR substrate-binding domain-containing protein [Salinisphaera sp.]|nr:LysR substrate-binding domain-containing protein [Salinisphaera sp.]